MMNELYTLLRLEIINLDKKNIYVEQTQQYFGFKYRKLHKSFANVYVQKELIRIRLSTLQEYSDPKKLLHEVNYKNWGALRKFVEIRSEDDLDNAMALVEQSFSFVSFYCQEKINNFITSPEPSYENSPANFLKKANDIGSLLNHFIDLKQIDNVSEIQVVEQFLRDIKETNDSNVLLIIMGRDIISLLNELLHTNRFSNIETKRVSKFLKVYSLRIASIEIYETR
ncbi:hypothetical protein G6659_02190 [Polynucleobacter paneuropaeus]|nr:hypothetical protein G6659_02190 [Polynucleobacter paneuropaeus]